MHPLLMTLAIPAHTSTHTTTNASINKEGERIWVTVSKVCVRELFRNLNEVKPAGHDTSLHGSGIGNCMLLDDKRSLPVLVLQQNYTVPIFKWKGR